MSIAELGSVSATSRGGARRASWRALALLTSVGLAAVAGGATPAGAAIVPTVTLGTAAQYAVLGGSTVTNTGNSVLDGSLGLWPGTSITGFPPGLVLAPGTTEATTPAAMQAQSDLTAAYVDAANRPLDATTASDLVNLTLVGGVYAGPGKSPLTLSGPLVLDGAGDPTSVFIFQTDSTLITASASTVTLINGAQECNVFWVVGSSATLGSGSVFRGTVLALDSVTVNNSVTVHGRALARNAAVTLDNDTFVRPTCAVSPVATTTTIAGAAVSTVTPGAATTLVPGGSETTSPSGTPTTVVGATTSPLGADTVFTPGTNPLPTMPSLTLPRTGAGSTTRSIFVLGLGTVALGTVMTRLAVRRPRRSR